MKLGYRDRLILMVVIVVVILGIGIFVFIKPQWEKLNANKETLKTVTNEWETKLLDFDKIPKMQNSIKKKYNEATDIAAEFTDEMDSIQLEELMQGFVNNDQFKADKVTAKNSVAVTDETVSTLNYYYYVPNFVTYPLYESADLDGSLAIELLEKLLESDILSARASQSVGTGTSTYTLEINREDTMALLNAIKEYADKNKDAMMITNVKILEPGFNENIEDNEKGQQAVDEEGNPVEAAPQAQKKDDNKDIKPNYTEVEITYKAYYIQEPTEPDVGKAYDSEVWNGNEWRNAVAE
ncbi:MAG: hypothetical protein MJ071_01105 [Oscillospiraceae bacterium]|nr:hypothetical protein [Oscillospiraceae bacterium]